MKENYLENIERFLDGMIAERRLFGIHHRNIHFTVLAKGFVNSETLELLKGGRVTNIEMDRLDKNQVMTHLSKIVQEFDNNAGINSDGEVAVALFCECHYNTSDRPKPFKALDIPLWKNPDDEFINIVLDYNKL